jgi:hypothetical protein
MATVLIFRALAGVTITALVSVAVASMIRNYDLVLVTLLFLPTVW